MSTAVLKKRDGTTAIHQPSLPAGTPALGLLRSCLQAGHRVVWGPLCRIMKRVPKGKERIHSVCKTCGDYIEIID